MADNGITVYGATWCGDCHRARRLLDEQAVSYRWVNVDDDPAALETVLRLNEGRRIVPTILFPDGTVLVEPSNRALLDKLQELHA